MADDNAPETSDDLLTKGRKALQAAALGASLFVGGQGAVTAEAAPPPPPPPEIPRTREEIRRDAIRDALLDQARRQYPSLLGSIRTSYSGDLQGMQQRVNNDLRAEGNRFHSQTVIIDPTKFDVGMAIGLNNAESVQAQLRAQGATAQPAFVQGAGEKMSVGFATKFGPLTYTQDPTAFVNGGGGNRDACVIVPASDHALPDGANIKGLSVADRVKFLDRHETWHCRDDRHTAQGIDFEQLKKVNLADPSTLINNAAACQMLALNYQRESFADVGGIGSMLREGYDMSLLDNVSAWRKERPADAIHITTPVLQGFKQAINDMGGIAKFRALSDDQAKELYYKVVDKYGVNGPAVQTAMKYEAGDGIQRLGHQIDAIFDKDSSRGIDFYRYFSAPAATVDAQPLTSQQTATLGRFDAQAQMEARAFQNDKKITPVTMIKAYTQLQEELRTQMKAHPDDQLYQQEMIKLQREFTTNVKTMDYVDANNRYGVKIENIEPVLAGLSGHPTRPGAHRTLSPTVKP